MSTLSYLNFDDIGAFEGLHQQYQQAPDSVEQVCRNFIKGFEFSKADFSQVNMPPSFNFNNSLSNTAVDGANALKLDDEVVSETNSEAISSQHLEDSSLQTQETVLENKEEENSSLILENEYKEEQQASNGLENFEIEDDAPELFNSGDSLETEDNDQEFSSFAKEENNNEEDELEIPAFLRRQKN